MVITEDHDKVPDLPIDAAVRREPWVDRWTFLDTKGKPVRVGVLCIRGDGREWMDVRTWIESGPHERGEGMAILTYEVTE